MQPKSIWIICVVWILVAGFVRGEQLPHGERILDFDSVIEVLGDASLTVTETITVVARQVHIKRGIYRELPTDISFDVLEVLRDGLEEPYRIEDNRIYIGEGPPFLTPGKYTYTLRYQVYHHLLFHEDADELQWDVTGRWPFLIDRIKARVVVPSGAEQHLLDSGDNRQDHWYQGTKSFLELNETFSIPSNRWWKEKSDQAMAGIWDDKYVIKFHENSGYKTYFANRPIDFCKSCELSAESEKIKGDENWGYGLRFGGSKQNTGRFLINGNGQYAILKGLENSVFRNKAKKWAFSPHIHMGNQKNHLKIEHHEGSLSFWVNGNLLESMKIPNTFRNKRVGFVVHSNGQSPTEIRFDNLRYAKTEDVEASVSESEESPLFFEIEDTIKANTRFQIFVAWERGFVERGWRGWLASAEHHWQDWWALAEIPDWLPDFFTQKLPTFNQRTNAHILAGLFGSVAGFYLLIWLFWLREPSRELSRSRTTPPEGLSPAAAHYLANKGYDDITFVSALTSLASKGFLSIQCLGPKKTKSSDNLWGICERDKSPTQEKSKDEDALLEKIFSYEATVKIYNENQKLFEKLMSEHKETLQEQLDDSHIQFHPRLVLMAIALYLLAVSGAAWWLHDGGMSAEFLVPLVFGIVGIELLFNGVSNLTSLTKIPAGKVFSTAFFGLACGGLALFFVSIFFSPEVLVFMLVLRLMNRWFCMKTQPYTVEGQKKMEQLDGFREYLLQKQSKAEPSFSGASGGTSAEKWFPYAIALGIEKEWRNIAKNSLPTPEWLEGANITDKFSPNPFIANFGASLSSAVATACSTPLWGISRSGGNSVFDGGGGGGGH